MYVGRVGESGPLLQVSCIYSSARGLHAGRETPSVACVVQPGNPGGFQKVFFGREEVAIPVQGSVQDAVKAHPRADVFINFASFRRSAGMPHDWACAASA